MKRVYFLLLFSTLPSCASMNESLRFGSGVGAVVGAASSYVAHQATGTQPKFEDVALGSGIGAGLGLLISYFTHKAVEQDRRDSKISETDMFFGDLPPNPFIFQRPNFKRGGGQ